MKTTTKDPSAVLDYTWNWYRWLGGDTISTITITATAGITVASSGNTTTTATVWLSGGTLGITYTVACLITTAGGRTDERSFLVTIENK